MTDSPVSLYHHNKHTFDVFRYNIMMIKCHEVVGTFQLYLTPLLGTIIIYAEQSLLQFSSVAHECGPPSSLFL